METIRSLQNTGFDTLFEAFRAAFGDYEIQINKDELKVMLRRRGFSQALSFGAFSEDGLVSFTFNGIGNFNGELTAYDTGTGTIPSYRGKGLAGRIFREATPYLKAAGIKQYLLEVLQHNTSAISVYEKQGFQISREFNYHSEPAENVKAYSREMPGTVDIRETSLDLRDSFQKCWDFNPSWQNNFEAIGRCPGDFNITGAFDRERLAGYGIFAPGSGDITQLAVHKNYRRMGIGTALLRRMISINRHTSIKAINIETSCKAMSAFLEASGIHQKGKQFEMIKML